MPVGGVPGGYKQGQTGQSCFDKVKMGFLMGCVIGSSTGFLFGGFQAFRFGLRGRELASTLVKAMAQAGGSFGVFMAVGTGLRC